MKSQESKFYVYALVDPINKVPFYFGKGCRDRAQIHGQPADKVNDAKLQVIKTLRLLEVPHEIMYVAQDLTSDEALKLESFCIEEWRKQYPLYKLTNKVRNPPPDRTGVRHTEEWKSKMSLLNKGQVPWIKGRTIENGGLPSDHGEKIKRGWLLAKSKQS